MQGILLVYLIIAAVLCCLAIIYLIWLAAHPHKKEAKAAPAAARPVQAEPAEPKQKREKVKREKVKRAKRKDLRAGSGDGVRTAPLAVSAAVWGGIVPMCIYHITNYRHMHPKKEK